MNVTTLSSKLQKVTDSVNTGLLWQHTNNQRNTYKNITHLGCCVLGSWLGGKEYMIEPLVGLLWSWLLILSLYSSYSFSLFMWWQQINLSIFLRLWTTCNIYSRLKQINVTQSVSYDLNLENFTETLLKFLEEKHPKVLLLFTPHVRLFSLCLN